VERGVGATVIEEGGELRPTSNLYTELYVEFIKGFKGKVSYNRWHGFDGSAEIFDFYTYPNIFAELSVENRLAKVRIQGRIRDWRTFRQIYAYGYDMEFNATGKLKGYFRILNVNEETEARATVYARVSYDVGYKAELFAEYGNGYDSDNLVNTDGFVTEGTSSTAFILDAEGMLRTQPLGPQILHGVTRRAVLRLARQESLRIAERPFTVEEAYRAREAFMTAASAFVLPIIEIDGHKIGGGAPGPVARAFRQLYIEEARKS